MNQKFLGYSFYFDKDGKCQLRLHPKTINKLKATLKKLTGRSNGMGYEQRKEALNLFIRGWVEYYTLKVVTLYRRIRKSGWMGFHHGY